MFYSKRVKKLEDTVSNLQDKVGNLQNFVEKYRRLEKSCRSKKK